MKKYMQIILLINIDNLMKSAADLILNKTRGKFKLFVK